ncbi:endoribonuclease L-PSP [Pandoraea captiosa]|uniref:Endoribonuclease L-PSP n=1 Tax=Pandoraea captiosa TaxID=2508302 RepID=A0A5E4ZJT4_9BURK|nr:RidA family protein [Pandoraea captiosa]VVE60530.1 endoribonuclease L-PSP [Pandoraea captiosa]
MKEATVAKADRGHGSGDLPPPFSPTGHYQSVVIQGGLAFVSGQLPRADGVLAVQGVVGLDVDIEAARRAAALCAANCLAVLNQALGGLDRVVRICRMTGYVVSAPGFHDHADVMDAASAVLVDWLGERGRHSRTSIGVAALPRRAPVEVDLVVAIRA